MATFQPVNTSLTPGSHDRNAENTTPTTPRPSTAPHPTLINRMDDATTPTRANFGALANQRPLPAQAFPTNVSIPENAPPESNPTLHRGNSQHSAISRDSDDVDMEGSDGGEEGSDGESVNDGTGQKKKKAVRFFCTEYPPCNLSFTRSEHLARHIR
jgi:hypothetical protein